MSSVASASLACRAARVTPGVLFRLSAVASAVAVGLVVVSAVLELGTAHWGIALVALPLLVANVVLARLAYPALLRRTLAALVSLPRRDRARRRRRLERGREVGSRAARRRPLRSRSASRSSSSPGHSAARRRRSRPHATT